MSPRTFLAILLVFVAAAQFAWFSFFHPQPVIYDAAEYVELSQQIDFTLGLPLLNDDGFRTYGFPLIVRPFVQEPQSNEAVIGTAFYLAQFALLLGLLLLLRRIARLPTVAFDAALIVIALALPVMVPYCIVVLSDLSGAAFLVGSLALMTMTPGFAKGFRRVAGTELAGFLLGFAIQTRPAYFHLTWPAVLFVAWTAWKDSSQPSLRSVRASQDVDSINASNWLIQERTRLGATSAAVIAFATGWLLADLPTLVDQYRQTGRVKLMPDQSEIMAYHLLLGLEMDRWTSNDPPFEEKAAVHGRWFARGWDFDSDIPGLVPTFRDYWREIRNRPRRAIRQAIVHVYRAFEKSELYPYAGKPGAARQRTIWWTNWLVLALGAVEAARLFLHSKEGVLRRLAGWHLFLLLYLAATCAPIVPEERFTLAAYPLSMVFAARLIGRALDRTVRETNPT